jgi:hypothetical protein
VAEAAMVGGRLVLTSYTGLVSAIDPATGRSADAPGPGFGAGPGAGPGAPDPHGH